MPANQPIEAGKHAEIYIYHELCKTYFTDSAQAKIMLYQLHANELSPREQR